MLHAYHFTVQAMHHIQLPKKLHESVHIWVRTWSGCNFTQTVNIFSCAFLPILFQGLGESGVRDSKYASSSHNSNSNQFAVDVPDLGLISVLTTKIKIILGWYHIVFKWIKEAG